NSGYILLAMGKMGARELNYSSDVDLIVFYDPAALVPGTEPAAFYVRLARAGEIIAGTYRRWLRVSCRSAATSRSCLDPDRHLHGGGARLLREPWTELGTRRADQGAAVCRRPCGGG